MNSFSMKNGASVTENLLLIRHFETAATVKSAFYGSTDLGIVEGGETRFFELTTTLQKRDLKHIYCSPKLRCRQTADIFFPNATVDLLEDAREVDFGQWEGMTFAQISDQYPEQVEAWQNDPEFAFPSGEALKDFEARVESLKTILESSESTTTVLVTHGGVIRYLICLYLGMSLKQSLNFCVDPGSITHIKVFKNGRGVLAGLNNKGDFTWPE